MQRPFGGEGTSLRGCVRARARAMQPEQESPTPMSPPYLPNVCAPFYSHSHHKIPPAPPPRLNAKMNVMEESYRKKLHKTSGPGGGEWRSRALAPRPQPFCAQTPSFGSPFHTIRPPPPPPPPPS